MKFVKIRKVGNSNVITLPQEFADAGYIEGVVIAIDQTPDGELVIVPESRLQSQMQEIARKAVEANLQALNLLEAYDRGDAIVVNGKIKQKQ